VNNRELYGLCTGSGSYGNNGSFFSRAWNWLASSTVGQWVGGLFGGDSSEKPATPDSSPNDSAATNSGDSYGSNHNDGAGWGSSGGYSGSGSGSHPSTNPYRDPNVLGVVNIYADTPGKGTWTTVYPARNENEIDGLSTSPLHGFGNDYDTIGAYQTQQAMEAMNQQETTHSGSYPPIGAQYPRSYYSNLENGPFYKLGSRTGNKMRRTKITGIIVGGGPKIGLASKKIGKLGGFSASTGASYGFIFPLQKRVGERQYIT